MSKQLEANLTESLESNFARYAGMVIQDRAIVDVRDGLKPAARQLMYAQYIEKLTADKPFKKATKSVAAGMSHFYVHGDASAYSTLIRMGKPFAVRYPLEAVQGSYGNQMENDNEAASRYVEMKLSALGTHLFDSIDKDTIDKSDWRENYDGTEYYPLVLPSIGFYNLVQGSTGIGVALASSIPQFNLKEMNNALIKLLWNPNIDFDEIYCAPDFATGATIINADEVKESIRVGTGPAIKIRGKIDIDYENNQLIVTELPYGVYTNTVCGQLAQAIEENPECGIVKFLDLTGITPLIKISLAKNANIGKVKEFLYKNTALQSYFSVNMVMLKDGKIPQVFGLQEAMNEYLTHSKKVLYNKITFDLHKAENRLEIVNGYLKALSIIDQIVACIKKQANSAVACIALMKEFDFSEKQAKAILDLKLNRLVNMEIAKIQQEQQSLLQSIDYYHLLLTNETEFLKVIEANLKEISNTYGDDRRTILTNIGEDAPIVEEKAIIAYVSNIGTIIAKETNTISAQKRGGTGAKIKFADKKSFIWRTIAGKTTDKVLVFTNKGQSYCLTLADIPIGQEIYINQILKLKNDEYITNIITFKNLKNYKYVIFATKNGIVKKTKISEFTNSTRKTGLIALKIQPNDELISTQLIESEQDQILLCTAQGMSVLFNQGEVTPTGRNTAGVKGITLNKDDYVCSMQIKTSAAVEIVVVTKKGIGKRIKSDELILGSRTNKGNKIITLKDDDTLVDVAILNSNEQDIIINSKTSSIRTPVANIPVFGRAAQGVNIIKLNDTNKVKNLIIVEN